MSDYLEVSPTGGDDTAILQAAINALSYPMDDVATGAYRVGTLRLSGRYKISQQLVTGMPKNGKPVRPVLIDGQGHSAITVIQPISGPAILLAGSGRCRSTRIKDLSLYCDGKCEGIALSSQIYCSLLQNVAVSGSVGCCVRAVNCYASTIDGCQFHGAGAGLYATLLASGHVSNCKFGCKDASWPTDIQADRRAACIVTGGNVQLTNNDFESCTLNDYPLLWLASSACTIRGMRWEKNTNRRSKVVIANATETWDGEHIVLEGISGADNEALGPGGYHCAVELRGRTVGVVVRDSLFAGLRDCVVDATSGTHSGVVVERVTTRADAISEGDYIQTTLAPP